MRDLITFGVIGVANGSIYAIAAMGLVLTFKTSGLFNFAHGAQAAWAAYLMHTLRDDQGLPWPLAALLAVLVAGVLGGLLLERLAALLAFERPATKVVATVGILVGLQSLLTTIYGSITLQFDRFLPAGTIRVLEVNVGVDRIVVTGLAAGATVGLHLLFQRTRMGAAMQAVVEDPALLDLRGTSPSFVRRQAWIIGSCFASVSGLLLATFVGLDSNILTLLVVFSFGAAAIGAFDSLAWTYVGGLVVGLGQAYSQRYLGTIDALAEVPANVPFIVLIVALLATPTRRLVDRGRTAMRPPDVPAVFPHRVTVAASLSGAGLLALVPVVFESRLPIWTTALGYAIVFLSLGLLVRTSGQVSLCHIAFAAVGASTFANAVAVGVPWLLALVCGGLAAGAVGAVVAIPAIRLQGVYLAVITFGFGLVVQRVFYSSMLMFGGEVNRAAPRPSLGSLDLTSDRAYYYVVLAAAIAVAGVVVLLLRSRIGLLARALAESPAALEANGANPSRTKLIVFAISAFAAGIGGGVIAPVTQSASGASFESSVSLVLLAVLFVAGRQPLLSGFVAAGLYVVAVNYAGEGLRENSGLLFGVAALAVATRAIPLLAQAGLRGRRAAARQRRARRPAAAASPRTAPAQVVG
jgi:branched-subunit amino acid ABC-type transport system permease component